MHVMRPGRANNHILFVGMAAEHLPLQEATNDLDGPNMRYVRREQRLTSKPIGDGDHLQNVIGERACRTIVIRNNYEVRNGGRDLEGPVIT